MTPIKAMPWGFTPFCSRRSTGSSVLQANKKHSQRCSSKRIESRAKKVPDREATERGRCAPPVDDVAAVHVVAGHDDPLVGEEEVVAEGGQEVGQVVGQPRGHGVHPGAAVGAGGVPAMGAGGGAGGGEGAGGAGGGAGAAGAGGGAEVRHGGA